MSRTEQTHDASSRDVDVAGPGPVATVEPTGGAARPRPPRRYLLMVLVGLAVLLADQLSKRWALNRLVEGPIDVVGSLRFNLAFNTGTAFSMGSGKGLGPWISLLAIAVVVGLSLGYTSRFKLGAVGNLTDRAFRGDAGFLHGAVVDFIDLQWWPVFNVADMAITVGGVILVVGSVWSGRRQNVME